VEPTEPDVDELRREIMRLGSELDDCEAATRAAQAEQGELRGVIAEMRVQLGRARQAQDWAETGGPTVRERVELWWSGDVGTAWRSGVATVRRSMGSVRRRLRSVGQSRSSV